MITQRLHFVQFISFFFSITDICKMLVLTQCLKMLRLKRNAYNPSFNVKVVAFAEGCSSNSMAAHQYMVFVRHVCWGTNRQKIVKNVHFLRWRRN